MIYYDSIIIELLYISINWQPSQWGQWSWCSYGGL